MRRRPRAPRMRFAMPLVLLALLLAIPFIASAARPQQSAAVESAVTDQLAAEGKATFWVLLRDQADLSRAPAMRDWNARGQFVVDQLQATADRSQAGLRALLLQRGVEYQTYWIANAIRVTAGAEVLAEIAARPEVERILAPRAYRIPEPLPGVEQARVAAIEWGVARINADDVWNTFGIRGEGVVVANIDTGVQHTHPALVAQYRGNQGGGVFDHNYNWHDPSRICGNPSLVPCDNNSHGTHTMGTMAGDDGGANQIGVAPAARWIAAKGCESSSCSNSALLSSAQWILAPTNLAGQSPRPDLRPNIVNNSWGGGPGDPWYQASVTAWVASGIFPAFSNGNSGPSCGSSGSPGDYTQSYSAGAFDINNAIASFSSRGPSPFGGEIKPNIAAPGVDVRSSIPGGYGSLSGTSMASPHVAGTVALMWSAAPALLGDIAATSALLDNTALDVSALNCGGTLDDNNVFGEGRLDAFLAVDQSPRGPTGTLAGTVTDAETGDPIVGATVAAEGADTTRTTLTDAEGEYSLTLPVGSYDVTASAYAYDSAAVAGVGITEGNTTTQNFALDPVPSFPVGGVVRDAGGNPLANATVTLLSTPLAPTTTDAQGRYLFPDVPGGSYEVEAKAGQCTATETETVVVNGPEVRNFALDARRDSFGYTCQLAPVVRVTATTPLALSGDDAATTVALPFAFSFYGQSYTQAGVSTNGHLSFTSQSTSYSNGSIPSAAAPNAAVYAFWDDLYVDAAAQVGTRTLGTAPNRLFVIEWRNVHFYSDTSRRINAQIHLYEDGRIAMQYAAIADDGRERGDSATMGIENAAGTIAFEYSNNQAALNAGGTAILFSPPAARP